MGSIVFWIIVAVAAFVIDIFTSSFLFVWFSIGAITAIFAAGLKASFFIQVIIFLIVGIISISIGYPWIRKKYKNSEHRIPLMEETYIGKIMVAEENIDQKATLKINGIYWTVINEGEIIHKGEKFSISSIDGAKFRIKKLEGENKNV
ncbi:NfeD family protein [Clostridium botulinum]|uniref:NfeD family protein n=1 Tax=Clostridium botulinum TaxID=1491 RepID=UPI0013CDD364|nr:NfeD family protein [Clostridium botulinum]NFG23841.1 NfeD family protein [Clostridium botulinum]NFN17712.1 NfeD family protein [Clostridium botulinum]NFN47243.1 NfeD family protein [Clostridium botulinum]NFO02952.1 NfeD family protein [Clostridium botulinum]NFR15395.1 NfeD family protein [Clostridium botulinum]